MNHVYVCNAVICNPHESEWNGGLWITDGIIEQLIDNDVDQLPSRHYTKIDARGRRIVPGFIDVHVHGGGGVDVMHADGDDLARMSTFHAAHGTTAFLATTVTARAEDLLHAVTRIGKAMHREMPGAELAGIHLEGPFLNRLRIGAQNPEFVRFGTVEELSRLIQASNGQIRLITLAPEMEGAQQVVQYAVGQGVTVSIGHSDATHEQMIRAVQWGATHVTHLFNGMRPLHHREPGAAGAALLLDDLAVELICDGVHVHRDLIGLVIHSKPKDKVVFVTDCIVAAGLEEGNYELGGLQVNVRAGEARLVDAEGRTGGLAGSCLTMDEALKNGLAFTNKPLGDILPALTINPALQIGLSERKGTLSPGKDADFVILSDAYDVQMTVARGKVVYERA